MRLATRGLLRRPTTLLLCAPRFRESACAKDHVLSKSTRGFFGGRPWDGTCRRHYSASPTPGINLPAREQELESGAHAPCGNDPRGREWDSLLDEAFIYGIRTKEQLCFEADIGHQREVGSRLIDKPTHRQNIELWHLLTRVQALMNGHEGIKAVWRGAIYRGDSLRFDNKDPFVNALWFTFLSAGTNDYLFLAQMCKIALRYKADRPAFFSEVVDASLEGEQPENASKIARWLLEPQYRLYRGRQDLLSAFSAACRSKTSALREFCKIYDLVPNAHIYDDIIAELWESSRASDAFEVHAYLISKRDLPSDFEVLVPFIRHLAAHDKQLGSFLGPLSAAGASFEAQARREWSRARRKVIGFSPGSMDVVSSNTLGTAPKKLSDEFIARAFATRAFSFDFAVNSLRLIGLIEVGPLAVREIASTAPDNARLQARFEKLKELEIDTGSSSFVQIIKKLCYSGQWEMIQNILNTDMHHEVFEDLELQKQLLVEYCRIKDWKQINRTLTILCHGEFNEEAKLRSAVLMVKSMLQIGDWPAAASLLRNLPKGRKDITAALPSDVTEMLRAKNMAELLRSTGVDQTAFVTGLLQDLLVSGFSFPVKYWRVSLRALGQTGRLRELEALIYWLAEVYRANGLYEQEHNTTLPQRNSDLDELFNETFQMALVRWCFKPRRGMRKVSPEQCLRWTRILKRLRDNYGVQIREHRIRWAYIYSLRWIFGPGMLSKPQGWMRRYRTIALKRYWNMYDKMWDMKPARIIDAYDRVEVVLRGGKPRASRDRGQQRGLPFREAPAKVMPQDVVQYMDIFHPSWDDYRK
ncbi:hypothetical protein PV08_05749 [Exophiala spinifera]|uniref:Pentatricopeptide repeat domain-containing protein n=1 Tax=Exophiala spinifera TaxID=91928 RepID=A0A0D2BWN2_9EURO|nr:uncharacterized protein PV08_05749 [Exophiala spinifera]KIW15699.1 hypothetical protein PV08_05749 [Exophiala spinifera]